MAETVQEVIEKFLDGTGVSQLWALNGQEIEARIADIKAKLATVAEGAQVNVIEGVQVNGVDLQVSEDGKKVNVAVPTGALASIDEVALSNLTTELQNVINEKADKATTLAGYGIEDAYTKEETEAELAKKADKATTLAGYGIENAYTKDETYSKTETEQKINSAIDVAVAGIYRVKGSITFAELPTEGIAEGHVYNVTDAFTTTDDAFVEGAGVKYPAGTNVVAVNTAEEDADPIYKWDCMAGVYDFSDFVKKGDIAALTSEEISALCPIYGTQQ